MNRRIGLPMSELAPASLEFCDGQTCKVMVFDENGTTTARTSVGNASVTEARLTGDGTASRLTVEFSLPLQGPQTIRVMVGDKRVVFEETVTPPFPPGEECVRTPVSTDI